MLWFSLAYGVEYAYTFIMFEEKSKKLFWSLFVLCGWLSVAFLSQIFHLNDAVIVTLRHMQGLRTLRIFLVIFGYSLLFLYKYDWKKILYLFMVGFLIHFFMEFSLFVSGIRPGNLAILIENSLIEFNMGVPFFYLLYDKYLKNRFV
jgi:hypothetical protein